MMAHISAGNSIYLYRLLKNELGVGHQASLARVEEALASDQIAPEDLDCTDTTELLENLSEFIRITRFKGGRIFATVVANAEYDTALENSESSSEDKAAKKGKPWKRARGSKALKPVRPRHKATHAAKTEPSETSQESSTETTAPASATTTPAPEQQAPAAPKIEQPSHTSLTLKELLAVDTDDTQEEPAAPSEEPESSPETSFMPSEEPTSEISAEETIISTEEPVSEVVSTSVEQPVPEVPTAPVEEPAKPAVYLDVHSSPAGTPPVQLQSDLPQFFSTDVHCKDATLALLYRVLPLNEDIMALLDEDWRVARSTGMLSGTRSKVTFPLRYLREDGSAPVEVTLRRTARPVAGKRWSLAYIDGDDGTGGTHEAIGLEGLPNSDDGAWTDFAPLQPLGSPAAPSPVREFAQFAIIGSWDALLGRLAAMVAPERWNYPGQTASTSGRYGILRDYLCATFHRAQLSGALGVAPDKSLAAFNTGLLTPFGTDVYACFEPHAGDIAWQFAGFACVGSGELGMRLAASLDPVPLPPTYLSTLSDVCPEQGKLVVIDSERIVNEQLGRLPRAFLTEQLEGNSSLTELLINTEKVSSEQERTKALHTLSHAIKSDPGTYRRLVHALDDACNAALLRCRVSYRTAAPAYDPIRNAICLLLPICLIDDKNADCALVLIRQPSGNYQGVSIISLAKAYACARVISAEQPAWLSPEKVL